MDPQWYWRRNGRQHGPISTTLLDDLIYFENIKDTDEIRLEANGTWMSASAIRALLASNQQSKATDSTATAAKLLAEAAAARPHRGSEQPVRQSGGNHALASIGSYIEGGIALCGVLLSAVLQCLFYLPSLLKRKTTLAIVAILLLAVLFKDSQFSAIQNQTALDEMSSIWEQLDQLQGRNASEADWSEFSGQARVTLGVLQADLVKTARQNPRDPTHYWTNSGFRQSVARSHLIQAGDMLQTILQSQGGDEGTQQSFQRKLSRANRLIMTNANDRDDPGDLPANYQSAGTSWESMIILLDVLVGAGLFFLWLKRRRS